MTSADLASPHAAPTPDAPALPRGGEAAMAPAFILFLGFAVSLALCWPRLRDIWITGDFHDPDDAMRMVQVRDFIAGQGWYDLTAWRIDPPTGSFMHWSRVVDVMLAPLVKLFSFFAPGETGERLARIVFPLTLQVALLASVGWVGRLLCGQRGHALAITLTVLSGFMFGQFVPGRVDHHAPQIVLLTLMIGAILAAFDPARARMAAVAALCAALSLAISIENLAYILILGAVLPVAWMARGAETRPALLWFAGGLAVALPVCFAIFNGPSRWLIPACDAFSPVHVAAGWAGALACAGLAFASRFNLKPTARIVCGVAAGGLAAAPLALAFPQCLGDPFVGLDPLVRDIWLNHVTEARPALQHFALHPNSWLMIALPLLLGAIAMPLAIANERGVRQARFIGLFAFTIAGSAAAFWMIRATTSLSPVALLGGVWATTRLWERLAAWAPGRRFAAVAAIAATLPFSSFGWALVAPAGPARDDTSDGDACRSASAFKPLAALPPGLVLAPIDAGSHILAFTPHGVLAAPYHRNNHGNRLAFDAWLAPPDAARALIVSSGARYVAFCPGLKEMAEMAERAPDGLAARLLRDDAPDWLRPITLGNTPYKVYESR